MVLEKLAFLPLSRRQIEADSSGSHITSDAGLLLLREVDKQHRLTRRLASVLHDSRAPEQVRHKLNTMVRQRVFGVDKLFVPGCTKLIAFFEYRLRIVDIRQSPYRYTV